MLAIPEYNIRLCSPTSTSLQMEVATRFAGDRGIIIQLNNMTDILAKRLCSFNCSWLSQYNAEDERLFFGGAYRIQIENIRNIATATNYGFFINPMYCFHTMINGTELIKKVSKMGDKEILINLIAHNLGIRIKTLPISQ